MAPLPADEMIDHEFVSDREELGMPTAERGCAFRPER